ncbi:MAG: hypothetical protein PHP08_00900 [Candidatus Dojkabacteria bacterium]|nr:hypothetical protein [Candidatus Dojkabacteria bacterium]
MATIGEEIEEWMKQYNKESIVGKYIMNQLAAAQFFKAEQIWKFVKEQPEITKEQYLKALDRGMDGRGLIDDD